MNEIKNKLNNILMDVNCNDYVVMTLQDSLECLQWSKTVIKYMSTLKYKKRDKSLDYVFKVCIFRRQGFNKDLIQEISENIDQNQQDLKEILGKKFWIPMFTAPEDKCKASFVCSQSNKYVFVMVTGYSEIMDENPTVIAAAVLFPTTFGSLLEFLGVDNSLDIQTFVQNPKSKYKRSLDLLFFRYNPNTGKSAGLGTYLLLMLQYIMSINQMHSTQIYAQVSPSTEESPYLFYCKKLGFIECAEPLITLEGRYSVDLKGLVYLKSPKNIKEHLICWTKKQLTKVMQ
jgi:hypothetical protein